MVFNHANLGTPNNDRIIWILIKTVMLIYHHFSRATVVRLIEFIQLIILSNL